MRRGITAIEIMVVIAIIGILAGLLIPAIAAKRERAQKANRKPNVSYVLKNSASYEVTLKCSNCGNTHKIEYTFGQEVKLEHGCPHCGVQGKLSLNDKE